MKSAVLWVLLLTGVCIEAQVNTKGTQQSKPVKPTTTVQHAEWSEYIQTVTGLTKANFEESGLAKLSADQFAHLVMFIEEQEIRPRSVRYTCEPTPPNYDKVRVLVTASDTSNTEVMSGIRQRLRSISDVQVVYGRSEADLEINVLAIEDHVGGSGRSLGYTVSVVTTSPCRAVFGDRAWDEDFLKGHFVHVGANASSLAEGVVTTLDTRDFEPIRSLHAADRKAYSPKP